MQMLFELFANRGSDAGRLVTDIETADAAGEIDVAISVDVGEGRAFGRSGEDRSRIVGSARHGSFAALHQRNRARTGDFRLDLNCGHFSTIRLEFHRDSQKLVWSRDIPRDPTGQVRGRSPT